MDINKVIIAEVQKYECLYNREMEEYRDNTYKDQVWTKIAKDIGLTCNLNINAFNLNKF